MARRAVVRICGTSFIDGAVLGLSLCRRLVICAGQRFGDIATSRLDSPWLVSALQRGSLSMVDQQKGYRQAQEGRC